MSARNQKTSRNCEVQGKEVQLKAHQCCGKKLSVRKVKTEEPMYFKKIAVSRCPCVVFIRGRHCIGRLS